MDSEVERAGLVLGLVGLGQEYVSKLPENAVFNINSVWVYQGRFLGYLMVFGLLYVGTVALTLPNRSRGYFREIVREVGASFLYLCTSLFVWTAFFPGIAIANPLLWNNFAWLYAVGVYVLFLAFLDWRFHGGLRRGLKRWLSSFRPDEGKTAKANRRWSGLRKRFPAASILRFLFSVT